MTNLLFGFTASIVFCKKIVCVFIKKLVNSGLNISSDNYDDLIKKIIHNLKLINKSETFGVEFLKTKKYFSNLEKSIIDGKKLVFVK